MRKRQTKTKRVRRPGSGGSARVAPARDVTAAEISAEITELLTRSLDPAAVAQRVADALMKLFRARAAGVFRLDPKSGTLATIGIARMPGADAFAPASFPAGAGVVGLVLREGRPVATANLLTDPRLSYPPDLRARLAESGVRSLLAVPLLIRNQIIGAVSVADVEGRAFDDGDVRMAQAFAGQAAIALENARLSGRQESRVARLQTLTRLNQLVVSRLDLDEVLVEIARAAATLMGAPVASFALADEETRTLQMRAWSDDALGRDFPKRIITFDEGIIGEVARTRRKIRVPDVHADERIIAPEWWRTHGLSSYLGVPVLRGDSVLAVLNLNDTSPFELAPEDEDLLDSFVAQAAVAIRNAQLHARRAEHLSRLQTLTRLNRLITSSLEMDDVLREMARAAATLMQGASASFALVDEATRTIELRAWSDDAVGSTYPQPRLGFEDGILGWIATHRHPVNVTDAQADPRFSAPAWLRMHGFTSYLGIPVTLEGSLLAILSLNARKPLAVTAEDKSLLDGFVGQAAVAIRNARLYAEAERQRRETEFMAEITRAISASLDLETVFQRITAGAQDLLESDIAMIGFLEGDGEAVTVRYRTGSRDPSDRRFEIATGKGLGGQVLVTGRPHRTDDYATDPRITKDYLDAIVGREGISSLMVVPIKTEQRVVGVLYVGNRSARRFTDHDEAVLTRLAEGAAVAIANAQRYARELEAERRYRSLFENATDPIATFGTDGTITSVNPEAARILGYTREELVGRGWNGLVTPASLARLEERMRQALAGGQTPPVVEATAVAKDGSEITIEGRLSATRDVAGNVSGWQVIWRDTTERKRAEAALRASEQALRESSEFQRQIIVSAREGIVVLDRELRYLVWNQFMEEMTGVPASGLLGKPSLEMFPALREHGIDLLLQRALSGETVSSPDYPFTVPETGRTGWAAGRYGPLLDADGTIIGVIATVRDVTERRRTEEALRRSEEQLRQAQKMEAIGRLAGGIAHDFNNLLTIITGRSELGLRRLAAGDAGRRDLELIKKTAERAALLTMQLLAFSRKQVLEPKVLDLNGIVGNAAHMLQRLIGEDIELVTLLEPRLGPVRVDPAQIEQIILNLAVNARDAMPQGGRLVLETANIVLDGSFAATNPGSSAGPYVRLRVSDTGKGMSPDVRAHVFEPFFTTKEVGKGTGLGLATVYGIVKQHDGYITVDSAPQAGTTFHIYLKRVDDAPTSADAGAAATPESRGWETILVVEDEDALRELACEILTSGGYHVLSAAGPGEGLEIAERHGGPIHLLLTDVVMPQMSGPDLVERLGHRRPEMKVLYMSGYTADAIASHGILEPGTRLLPKPFSPDELTGKVREVLTA